MIKKSREEDAENKRQRRKGDENVPSIEKNIETGEMMVLYIRGMAELTTVEELEKALKDVTGQEGQ
jgi:predicted acyltransferase (DUF342 family)